jgi:succinate dehydrogenase/fumarate reductase cytochrome b subunit
MRETPYWTWHLVAAVLILVFLSLHMVIMHLNGIAHFMNPAGAEATAWQNVVSRVQTLFFPVTYIFLLGAALYHGLYGTRVLLLELNPKPAVQKLITASFWTIGTALFVLGTVANIVAHIKQAGG